MESLVTLDIEGRSITVGSAPGGAVTVEQPHGLAALHVSVDQAFSEVSKKLVQSQELVALAHSLTVAVHQHQNRAGTAALHRIQDVARQANRLVHTERGPTGNANHHRAATGPQRPRPQP